MHENVCNISNLLCIRLEFGVPLEDIFPLNDINSHLKILFKDAVDAIYQSNADIVQLLSNSKYFVNDCMILKEKLLNGNLYLYREFRPICFLWLIRHFLGCLPISLLPNYVNGKSINWKLISVKCKEEAYSHSNLKWGCSNLMFDIEEAICKLPNEHFLLMDLLFKFLRTVSAFDSEEKINKRTALYLAKYFSSSVFCRPFRPGVKSKKEKAFIPLMYFLIMFWPDILLTLNNSYKIMNYKWLHFNYLNRLNFDNATQTIIETTDKNKDFHNLIIEDKNIYLKDVGCQTKLNYGDNGDSTKKKICCCEYGSHYEQNKADCSDLYNSSFIGLKENFEERSKSSMTEAIEKVSVQTETDPSCTIENYGWKDHLANSIRSKEAEEYMYDDYETFKCEKFNQITEEENAAIRKIFQPLYSKYTVTPSSNTEIIDKMSKIGWTYTPRPSNDASLAENANVNYHQTYFDKENGNQNQNEVLVQEQTYDDFNSLGKCDSRKLCLGSSIESISKASKRSLLSLKLFKKLDILKKIKRRSLRVAPSYESVTSRIKYKKLNKTKSNTF